MTDSLPPRLADLQARYAESLPAKRAALADAWSALAANGDARAVVELQALTHRLAGSAPSYGYESLGARASTVDTVLNAWLKTSPAEREAANALAKRIAAPVQALLDGIADAMESKPEPG